MLEIGKIVNTHGLRGEVKIVPWTDYPDDFERIKNVCIKMRDKTMDCTIKSVKYQKNNIIVAFNEIKDIITHNIERFEKIDSLFEYQQNIIKRIGSSEVIIESEYDFYSYFNRIYLNEYKELEEKRSILKITDKQKVSNINDFAREVVWYGRNKRATDYTSNNYMVEII